MSSVREEQLRSLADVFSSAALQPELWMPGLETLADATGSEHAEIVGVGLRGGYFNWTSNNHDAARDHFVDIGGGDPQLNFRVAAGLKAKVGELVFERHYQDVVPTLRGREYLDFCQDWQINLGCQSTLAAGPGFLIGLSILRSDRRGATGEVERDLFSAVAPHVRTAVRTRMALEQEAAHLLAGTLEIMGRRPFSWTATAVCRRSLRTGRRWSPWGIACSCALAGCARLAQTTRRCPTR